MDLAMKAALLPVNPLGIVGLADEVKVNPLGLVGSGLTSSNMSSIFAKEAFSFVVREYGGDMARQALHAWENRNSLHKRLSDLDREKMMLAEEAYLSAYGIDKKTLFFRTGGKHRLLMTDELEEWVKDGKDKGYYLLNAFLSDADVKKVIQVKYEHREGYNGVFAAMAEQCAADIVDWFYNTSMFGKDKNFIPAFVASNMHRTHSVSVMVMAEIFEFCINDFCSESLTEGMLLSRLNYLRTLIFTHGKYSVTDDSRNSLAKALFGEDSSMIETIKRIKLVVEHAHKKKVTMNMELPLQKMYESLRNTTQLFFEHAKLFMLSALHDRKLKANMQHVVLADKHYKMTDARKTPIDTESVSTSEGKLHFLFVQCIRRSDDDAELATLAGVAGEADSDLISLQLQTTKVVSEQYDFPDLIFSLVSNQKEHQMKLKIACMVEEFNILVQMSEVSWDEETDQMVRRNHVLLFDLRDLQDKHKLLCGLVRGTAPGYKVDPSYQRRSVDDSDKRLYIKGVADLNDVCSYLNAVFHKDGLGSFLPATRAYLEQSLLLPALRQKPGDPSIAGIITAVHTDELIPPNPFDDFLYLLQRRKFSLPKGNMPFFEQDYQSLYNGMDAWGKPPSQRLDYVLIAIECYSYLVQGHWVMRKNEEIYTYILSQFGNSAVFEGLELQVLIDFQNTVMGRFVTMAGHIADRLDAIRSEPADGNKSVFHDNASTVRQLLERVRVQRRIINDIVAKIKSDHLDLEKQEKRQREAKRRTRRLKETIGRGIKTMRRFQSPSFSTSNFASEVEEGGGVSKKDLLIARMARVSQNIPDRIPPMITDQSLQPPPFEAERDAQPNTTVYALLDPSENALEYEGMERKSWGNCCYWSLKFCCGLFGIRAVRPVVHVNVKIATAAPAPAPAPAKPPSPPPRPSPAPNVTKAAGSAAAGSGFGSSTGSDNEMSAQDSPQRTPFERGGLPTPVTLPRSSGLPPSRWPYMGSLVERAQLALQDLNFDQGNQMLSLSYTPPRAQSQAQSEAPLELIKAQNKAMTGHQSWADTVASETADNLMVRSGGVPKDRFNLPSRQIIWRRVCWLLWVDGEGMTERRRGMSDEALMQIARAALYLLHYHDYGCELAPEFVESLIQTVDDAESFVLGCAPGAASSAATWTNTAGSNAGARAGTSAVGTVSGTVSNWTEAGALTTLGLALQERNPAQEHSWQGKMANLAKSRLDVEAASKVVGKAFGKRQPGWVQPIDLRYLPPNSQIRAQAHKFQGQHNRKQVARAALYLLHLNDYGFELSGTAIDNLLPHEENAIAFFTSISFG